MTLLAFVEAYVRKPTVRDGERMPDGILTFAGLWRNPVTRILIVAVASGLGTAIAFGQRSFHISVARFRHIGRVA